jgi:fatty acid kinase
VSESEAPLAAPVVTRRAGEPALKLPFSGGTEQVATTGRRGAAAVAPREEGWGYCTEFLISGPGLDVDAIREDLGKLGESALVVGDDKLIRVHIHTPDPAALIAAAAQRGRMTKLKVEDMSAQHHDILERAGAAENGAAMEQPAAAPKPLGVVTVASGAGFHEILKSLGADDVVLGGQTTNPSIEDLLNGVRSANARAVILLPNNSNVILTAQQVNDVADGCDVHVVPTRNLPQGISALLAYDPAATVEANRDRMTEAIQSVRAVEVTRAVRDSTFNGHEIKEGDVIAIVDDEITQVGASYRAVIEAVLDAETKQPELVTVYRGADVSAKEATSLVTALRKKHSEVEFELHDGGQEHYPYVLSLE